MALQAYAPAAGGGGFGLALGILLRDLAFRSSTVPPADPFGGHEVEADEATTPATTTCVVFHLHWPSDWDLAIGLGFGILLSLGFRWCRRLCRLYRHVETLLEDPVPVARPATLPLALSNRNVHRT